MYIKQTVCNSKFTGSMVRIVFDNNHVHVTNIPEKKIKNPMNYSVIKYIENTS